MLERQIRPVKITNVALVALAVTDRSQSER